MKGLRDIGARVKGIEIVRDYYNHVWDTFTVSCVGSIPRMTSNI